VRPLALAAVLALALLAGCGGEEGPRIVIVTPEGERTIAVEIADSEGERARGLMGRESLDADAGMVFVFPAETSGAFWMKNTLIPLSIAFYDVNGRILRILDMEPCRRDPCPLYDPGVSYRGALEVNRGAFREWGVGEGDTLTLER
jgi:uncharacterized protein